MEDHNDILQKYLNMFQKMMKNENMIRGVYVRIETEIKRATRILWKIAKEEKEEM